MTLFIRYDSWQLLNHTLLLPLYSYLGKLIRKLAYSLLASIKFKLYKPLPELVAYPCSPAVWKLPFPFQTLHVNNKSLCILLQWVTPSVLAVVPKLGWGCSLCSVRWLQHCTYGGRERVHMCCLMAYTFPLLIASPLRSFSSLMG